MMLLPNLIARFLATASLLAPKLTSRLAKPVLRLDCNDEFHLAIFSDLHYGEEEDGWGITQDVNSTRVMNNILDYEVPDFVILMRPLVERGLKWASTYGNHDSQYNLSRHALFDEESKNSVSYTQHASKTLGITNYYLPLYPSLSRSDCESPVAILWFFDSQGGAPFQADADSEEIPDWVTPDIVSWFVAERKVLAEKWGPLPSLAFVHIPPTAFLTV
ncbi:putative inactive purple acid phosphatase 16 [Hyphodiscus hymeniophilus]|uniref:Inactive purple acid phosphatase 16 n=1 Tax=Hyphodiscus hymeniophilus TaxID=353542 RepID=A0A9P6VF26_9HELO|nr:putative inactive purple acid phosphatase 16 [Hyphodiscus hymeniophilus]